MASTDYLLSILAVFKDKATGDLKKFSGNLDATGKQAAKSSKSVAGVGSSIVSMAKGIAAGTAGVVAIGMAMKKAFDIGKEGAAIQQTTESFDGLIRRLGVTPDLLDDLKDASDGTVSEMKLMSATTTLLAGAQGELANQLAGATPELLEIAKAANKLNPTLGDTTFLYESLATGIKRASPMILDNLGLTIKVGEANEIYAESLGKTVEQLTAEEQKIALLNEVRRAGTVLITQAGGAGDSATDSFARLEAATEDIGNAFKKALAPAVADVVEVMADFFTMRETLLRIAKEETEEIRTSAEEYEEYETRIRAAAKEQGFMIDSAGNMVRAITEMGVAFQPIQVATSDIIETNKLLTRETWALQRAMEGLAQDGANQLTTSFYKAEGAAIVLAASTDILIQKERDLVKSQREAREEQERLNAEMSALSLAIRGDVGRALDDYTTKQDDLEQQSIDLREAIAKEELALSGLGGPQGYGGLEEKLGRLDGAFLDVEERMNAMGEAGSRSWQAEDAMRGLEWEATSIIGAIAEVNEEMEGVQAGNAAWDAHAEKLAALRGELALNEDAIAALGEEHRRVMNEMVFDMALARMQADGVFSQAEMNLATSLAESMGLIDEATATSMRNVNQILTGAEVTGAYGVANDRILALAESMGKVDVEAIGIESAMGALEVGSTVSRQKIGAKYESVGKDIADTSLDVADGLIEIDNRLDELIEEPYEIQLGIKDEDDLMKGMGYLNTVTRFLEGTHPITFAITTTGEFPDGGGGPGGPTFTPIPDQSKGDRQLGGPIPETGLYNLHAGEYVLPPMEAQQMASGGGGTTVTHGVTNNFNLNVTSTQEMTSLMQQFETMRAIAGA